MLRKTRFIGALIGFTLGAKILTCWGWVKEIVLPNIPENPDIVMHKDAGHT
ncbi:hypothetical protein [Holospora curviuscula]|uniref:hypothetical protein n=1 Tax=Holospora curviuscula TaxID=1082868 RepID=UPI0013FD4186|nr:hypothetical protein [Holospora curviuscula]